MNGLMTTSRPAGSLLEPHRVIRPSDENSAARGALEMAFQTEIGITNRQHLGVNRSVGGVTDRASFARSLVLEYIRSTLRRMTADAPFGFRHPGRATRLVNRTLMRRM